MTNTKNIVEFWSDRFIMKDLRHGGKIVSPIILDSEDGLYKLCDSWTIGLTALVVHADDVSQIWHELFGHLKIRSMNMMVT